MTDQASRRLVLASGSETRRLLLEAAGIAFEPHASDVDEGPLKHRLRADGACASDAALALAAAKAIAVDQALPGALVIGADQILTCGERWFDKPADRAEARRHLEALRGREQVLHTACVLALGGQIVWRHIARPRLTMRAFSDDVLDAYLAHEGDAVCMSVGACRIEGPGYLLLAAIDGEHAAILGLPMLALADELRHRGILAS